MKGIGIGRYELYLKSVGMSLGGLSHWTEIRDLQKVRNCIAHSSGDVDDSRDGQFLRRLAAKGIGLELEDDGDTEVLVIRPEYCNRINTESRLLLEEIPKLLFPDHTYASDGTDVWANEGGAAPARKMRH
jgi:hypothetical protein